MVAPCTHEDYTARAEALEECADHLDLAWTDNQRERTAGEWLASKLRAQAEAWRRRAQEAKSKTPNSEVRGASVTAQPACEASASTVVLGGDNGGDK